MLFSPCSGGGLDQGGEMVCGTLILWTATLRAEASPNLAEQARCTPGINHRPGCDPLWYRHRRYRCIDGICTSTQDFEVLRQSLSRHRNHEQ